MQFFSMYTAPTHDKGILLVCRAMLDDIACCFVFEIAITVYHL